MFKGYKDPIGRARRGGGAGLANREIGKWIAEDYRLMLDPDSPYPHNYAFESDLRDSDAARERREALKKAMKW